MDRNLIKKLILLILVIALLGGVYLYRRPVPDVAATPQTPAPPKTQAISLPWPATGQAALGAKGYGVLASNNTSTPVPIASIAKVIAAMSVLQQKPLAIGEQGPMITLDSSDLDFYNYYYLNDGSAAKVTVGEQISEYQALQGMLLPSANNIADSLTRWAFGSAAAYTAYANQMIKSMALTNTTVVGASGFADDATSTASDLVSIGIAAIADPVIAQIVNQQTANIPVAGDIKNVNWLLGTDGVDGIKTGNTDKAGGCYLFSADQKIEGQTVTMVGAILGAPNLSSAISAARPLLAASPTGFTKITPITAGQTLGIYLTAWGDSAKAVAKKDVSLLVWKGDEIKIINKLDSVSTPIPESSPVGSVAVRSGKVSANSGLMLSQELPAPPITWRFTR